MLHQIKKDFTKLLKLIQKEGLMSSADTRELDIDKMSLMKLFIASQALCLSLIDYAELIELEYAIEDNDDFFESLRKSDYQRQELKMIIGFLENINAISDKCFVLLTKRGL